MNKRIIHIIACCAALFYAAQASAVVVQKIVLKDGTVFNGYIQSQSTDGNMTVYTDNAIVSLKSTLVSNTIETEYTEADLDKAWIEWGKKNETFNIKNGTKTLTLSDINTKDGKQIRKVRILEKGEVIKYLEVTPNRYNVNWSDVEAIRGIKRAKNALSGINRIHFTKDGHQYEGEFAEETDSTLSLYTSAGFVQTLRTEDIVKYVFKPLNPKQDIFEQSPTLDIVKLQNNLEIVGVIIEQNYTEEKANTSYIFIKKQDGTIQSINISDIAEIRKKENEAYNPLFDILLKDGEIKINRNPVNFITLKENGNNLILEGITDIDKAEKNIVDIDDTGKAKIILEYRDDNSDSSERFKLVKISKNGKKKKVTVYGFTYKSLLQSVSPVSDAVTSVNNTTKLEYQVKSPGYYALYDMKDNKAILVVVK